ncbi:MAG: HD domain-containing protein [Butyrivibrio sp.]|uniref:HD domain-containing phosphohydrolase n=1 Tax=Butyrivibrio sp. TaxID=28121 RepID=UPI001B19E0A0|nr:HD domain-containing phosphohydrolase [Butyrivibrio sp.]MBO6239309.1 HD domain-containing protein [Butyrivibrio sp.]
MKLGKTTKLVIVFLSLFVILFVAYYTVDIIANNYVSASYEENISLTGARLSDEFYSSMTKAATWESATGYASQFDFEVYNTGNSNLSNWIIKIELPSGSKLENYWGVEAAFDESSCFLYLKPTYYNNVIYSGENIVFGIIVTMDEVFTPTEISIKGYKISSELTDMIKRIILLLIIVLIIVFVGLLVTRVNVRNYKERQRNDVKIILQSMNTFINFIDAKDPYTRGHSRRVAMYAAEIAKRMGLSEDEIQNIYYAGLLHDAGKISVPDAVLNKPGKLSDEERKAIQNHTVAGGKMLLQLSSLRGVRETALYHHERYDGTGYPDGLKGDIIPLYARIVGVADSYDAMSSNRVYRRHLNKDEIIEEIQKGAGTQFDPSIVKYMVDMINDGYVNVVKMETAEADDDHEKFHLTEDDIPGVYMGFQQ